MKAKIKNCVLLLIFMPLLFCKPAKMVTSAETSSNKILFLAYELKKDSIDNNVSAKLVQQIIADGKLKEEERTEAVNENDLQILFLSSDNEVIQQKTISDPFIKHLEGIGNSNTLERVEVKQSVAEITFRINLKPSVQKIRLQYFDNKGSKIDILTHQLTN